MLTITYAVVIVGVLFTLFHRRRRFQDPGSQWLRNYCIVLAASHERVVGMSLALDTGVKSTNVRDFLALADGAIVGSDLKVDGGTWNPVDPDRASRFMAEVRAARVT